MKRYDLNEDKIMVESKGGMWVRFDDAHDLLLLAGRMADAARHLVGGQDPTTCSICYGAEIMSLSLRAQALSQKVKDYDSAMIRSSIDF